MRARTGVAGADAGAGAPRRDGWPEQQVNTAPLPDAPRRTLLTSHINHDAASHDAQLHDAEPEAPEQDVPPPRTAPLCRRTAGMGVPRCDRLIMLLLSLD